MSFHRRTAAAALTALTATTAGAGGAAAHAADAGPAARASAAGTLVFIKNDNVWLSNGDGSNARALTADGSPTSPYRSPSQSNTGVIAVGKLDEIVRMDQAGHVLNRMNPPALPSSVSGQPIDGNLLDVAISPDGSLIAFSMAKFLTPPGAESGYRYATGYTAAGGFTDSGARGTTFFEQPSWVGNTRTLQYGGYGSQVMIDDLDPNDPVHWFDDSDIVGDLAAKNMNNAEVSPNGRYVSAIRGDDEDTSLVWYRISGDASAGAPPPVPTPVCELPGGFLDDPTWAPDGDSLAWSAPDGIHARAGAEDCSGPSSLIVAGAAQPDWSPAPLSPPVHTTPPPPPGPVPTEQPGKLDLKKRPKIVGKAVVGRVLKASAGTWSPKPVKVRFTWKRNGKAIKGAHSKRYKVTRKDRGRKLTVTVTATRTGWKKTVATSRAVRVRKR